MSHKNFHKEIFNIGGFFKKSKKQIAIATVLGLSIASIAVAGFLMIKNSNQQDAYAASDINILLIQLQTGTAPFDANDNPGNDSSISNDIVRTRDTMTYQWQFSVNPPIPTGGTQNVRISQTLPTGLKWVALPPQCLTSGVTPASSISGDGLTILCNVGTVNNSSTLFISPQAVVKGGLSNGSILTTSASIQADDAPLKNTPSVSVTVSSAPKFDLVKRLDSNVVPYYEGPAGEPGSIVYSFISLDVMNDRKGLEQLQDPITIIDDLSTVDPQAKFVNWGSASSQNCNIIAYPNQNYMGNAGTVSCAIGGANNNTVTATITGADTGGDNYSYNVSNGQIGNDISTAVTGFRLIYWVPTASISAPFEDLTNTVSKLVASSISGQPNYGVNGEPIENNNLTIRFNNDGAKGNGTKFFYGTNRASGHNPPSITPNEQIGVYLGWTNTGNTPYSAGMTFCDKVDNKVFTVVPTTLTPNYSFSGSSVQDPLDFTLEYGTGGYADATAQKTATCEAGDSPDGWFTDANLVPGGVKNISKIRITLNQTFKPGNNLYFVPQIKANSTFYGGPNDGQTIPVNFKMDNYLSIKFAEMEGGNWVNDDYSVPNRWLLNGYDFTYMNLIRVRVAKETDPAAPSGQIYQAQAGTSVKFRIKPTAVTSDTTIRTATSITLTDTLPAEFSYINGSSNLPPTSVTLNGDGTTTIVWNTPATSNIAIPDITFDALLKIDAPNLTQVVNKVVIASPDDISDARSGVNLHEAQVPVMINNGGSFNISKETPNPFIQKNEAVNYTIKYVNQSDQDIAQVQFVDILPHNSDGRTPATNYAGSLVFSTITGANGETFEYTKAVSNTISNDPNNASNQGGGSTTWCNSLSGGSCPANNNEVTAIRITALNVPKPNPTPQIRSINLTLNTNGNTTGNIYTNNFGARASGLILPVFSNDVSVLVVASSISDLVWQDVNADGIQNNGELGIGGVTVELYALPQTKTVTYTCVLPYSLVRPRNCDLPKFDPSLGSLTSASISNDIQLFHQNQYENIGNGAATVNQTVQANSFVKKYDGSTFLTVNLDQNFNYSLPQFDGTIDYAGTSGITSPEYIDYKQGGYNVATGDLPSFISTSPNQIFPIEFNYTDLGSSASQSGNLSAVIRTFYKGSSSVTYTYTAPGGLIDTTTTDSSGNYIFPDLTSGEYMVKVIPPTNYSISPKDQGANDLTDSDIDPVTGFTETINLGLNENQTQWDAGLFQPASISNFVWLDENRDGIQNSGEPGISGVTVNLLNSAGTQIATTTTDANGNYIFEDLQPGSYIVEFIFNNGETITLPNQGGDTALDSDINATTGRTQTITLVSGENNQTIDAGAYLYTISNFVWQDVNADGIQDVGEPGISGVTVNLLNSSGTQIATTTTDGSGTYSFESLPNGDYIVEFVNPGGYIFANPSQGGNAELDSNPNTVTGRSEIITINRGDNNTIDAGFVSAVDLELTKTVDNATRLTGQNAIFTITANNTSNINATGVTVLDVLPAGLTYISDNSNGAYNNTTGIWTIGNLNANSSASLQITVTSQTAATYLNIAEIESANQPDTDSTPGDNNGSETVSDFDDEDSASIEFIEPIIDLELTKSVNNATRLIGQEAIFTITANNTSNINATGVTVLDVLPAGLTYVSDNSNGGYSNTTGIWNIGNLNVGQSVSLQITVTSQTAATYLNIAEIETADQADVDSTPGDNNGSETVSDFDDEDSVSIEFIEPIIDLELTKTVSNATPNVGDQINYTITANNVSSINATGVTVLDLLPTGLTYISDNSNGAYNNVTGIWTIGNINANSSASLQITASVNTFGTITNIAEVETADQSDVDSTPGNNNQDTNTDEDDEDLVVITVPQPQIDLELTKTVDNATRLIGQNAIFTITANNVSSVNATGITVLDLLPTGLTYVSDNSNGAYNQTTGIWTIGNINANSSTSLQITVTSQTAGTYLNIAEIESANQPDVDSTPGNNNQDTNTDEDDEDSVSIEFIEPIIDLELTKSVSTSTPTLGDEITYSIYVINNSAFTATGVTVKEPLANQVTYISSNAAATSTTYDATTGIWNIGTLAPNQSITLEIVVTVDELGQITNIAQVETANEKDADSVPGNNNQDPNIEEDDEDVVIIDSQQPKIDLELTKTVDNATRLTGQNAIFTITANNTSNINATGVTVLDVLPTGLTYVSDNSNGAYNNTTGIWTIGNINANSSASLQITVTSQTAGTYLNIAEIESANQPDIDSTPGNNNQNANTDEDDEDKAQIVFTAPQPNPQPQPEPRLVQLVRTGGTIGGLSAILLAMMTVVYFATRSKKVQDIPYI